MERDISHDTYDTRYTFVEKNFVIFPVIDRINSHVKRVTIVSSEKDPIGSKLDSGLIEDQALWINLDV
jgi:hypothetical protein